MNYMFSDVKEISILFIDNWAGKIANCSFLKYIHIKSLCIKNPSDFLHIRDLENCRIKHMAIISSNGNIFDDEKSIEILRKIKHLNISFTLWKPNETFVKFLKSTLPNATIKR